MSQAATSLGVAGAADAGVGGAGLRQPAAAASAGQRTSAAVRPAWAYDSWTFFTSPLSCTSQVWIALL
jgi:hypothetical protein